MTPRDLPPLLGESPSFLTVLEEVSRAAPLDRPVLVIGERGTGKELVAARLHFLSPRWDRPFVKINCAALPESLLEAELFGHEAGAFTGAARRRLGRFERADGGTLFLDEVANAALAVQEKILRVIEYGEFERLGSSETIAVDVRILAATNVDLPSRAEAGAFRHDLLDRLAFDVVTLPPLRARPEDIILLAESFGRAFAAELGWDAWPGFSRGAAEVLLAYPWPGNVRQLRNAVERAVYRADDAGRPIDAIETDPFASPFRPAAPPGEVRNEPVTPMRETPSADTSFDYQARVAAFETGLLQEALAAHRHSQRATAAALGLSYDQLRHKLKKFDLLPSND